MDNHITDRSDNAFSTLLDVRQRLEQQRLWYDEWQREDKRLADRIGLLDPSKPLDREKGQLIASLRRRLQLTLVKECLDVAPEVVDKLGLKSIRLKLVDQFLRLTQDEKMLWMQNFRFIMTPQTRSLDEKISNVRAYRSVGQQRNFLLGGDSGMGKTTYLNWFTAQHIPDVERERNHVPVIKIDAPVNNKSPKPLFQRMILECGMTYHPKDNEEDLLAQLVVYIQKCGVEVIIVDEIEHLVRHELRRRLLEVSNVSPGVPIICASCTPEQWVEGDSEIAGRWNDYFGLVPYKGERLEGLLTFIEIFLPFTRDSQLGRMKIKSTDGKQQAGPASLIEGWTKGVLRDIMILICDASQRAIQKNQPCLSPTLLLESWRNIQTNSVPNLLRGE